MSEPIAHSGSDRAPKQPYRSHVMNVMSESQVTWERCAKFYTGPWTKAFTEIIRDISRGHDIGKLSPRNQDHLEKNKKEPMFNHVDAGVAFSLQQMRMLAAKYPDIGSKYADHFKITAAGIEGHHIGLLNHRRDDELKLFSHADDPMWLRDTSSAARYGIPGKRVCDVVDESLADMVNRHNQICADQPPYGLSSEGIELSKVSCLSIRMLMSIIAHADHGDTARSQGFYAAKTEEELPLSPQKRLDDLVSFVQSLGNKRSKTNRLRDKLFEECMNVDLNHKCYLIDAAVGLGKTFSGIGLALRLCIEHGHPQIFHISPFINIISQTAKNFRNAFDLNRMSPEIAEHHHIYDFLNNFYLKANVVTWHSPFTCTSAVQLVHSLVSNKPVVLRKIHRLVGAVLVIDEYDQSIPFHLWEHFSHLLRELIDDWGCRVIFCSGTPTRFWDIKKLRCESIKPTCIVASQMTRKQWQERDRRRVAIKFDQAAKTGNELLDMVFRKKGPRLIVLNTRRNAALLAHFARRQKRLPAKDIYHLSNALSKKQLDELIEEIKIRLQRKDDIAVFATSVVDTGIDLSFRHGFVEARSISSMQQASGRICRHNEYRGSTLTVFLLRSDEQYPFTNNTDFGGPRDVQTQMLREGLSDDAFTESVERYLAHTDVQDKMKVIREAEDVKNFTALRKECKVIDETMIPVLCDKDLFHDIIRGTLDEDVNTKTKLFQKLRENSFTLFPSDMPLLCMEDCIDYWDSEQKVVGALHPGELCLWDGGYDDYFLGYMNEVLFRLGIEGVERAPNPADGFRSLARDLLERLQSTKIGLLYTVA